jgi:LysR family glycine cleavage system transcriptional activator
MSASGLLKFPILRLDDWSTWGRWFEAAGLTTPPLPGPVLNRASMLIDAAIDGQGVTLARTAHAALHGRSDQPVSAAGSVWSPKGRA